MKLSLINQATPPAGTVNISDPLPVTGVAGAEVLVGFGDVGALDAFGRLRISDTGLRVDNVFTYDKQPLLFDEITSGAGSATHDANLRAVYLSTGGVANGNEATLRLHYNTPYTPGNSQFIAITGTLNPDNIADWTNAKVEFGYGDELNAVGFRYDASGASIFLRSSISGVTADLVNEVQADWNQNIAAGVDWTKSQIFLIDFQSLAIGRIRLYLDRGGVAILVHTIENDNLRVGPYWQLASLPPYWQVKNTGVANATIRALAVCCTVKSEGAPDLASLPGFAFTASNGATPKTVSSTLVPLISIQLKTTFGGYINRGLVRVEDISILGTNPMHYQVLRNPTLTNSAFGSVNANSICNFDVGATAVAGGRAIVSGYVSGNVGGSRSAAQVPFAGRTPLSLNALGTVGDILTIAAVRVGSQDSSGTAALNWQELR